MLRLFVVLALAAAASHNAGRVQQPAATANAWIGF